MIRQHLSSQAMIRITALCLAMSSSARAADWELSAYSGYSATMDGDLGLKQAGGTDLSFRGVSWEGRSFESPIFYGGRIGRWFESHPEFGFAVDFTHAKTYLRDGDSVRVRGIRNGLAVDGVEPVNTTIESFNMSHGLNFVTFNLLYRWLPAGVRDETPLGRMEVYAGAGAGFVIPHVEAVIGGTRTSEYQFDGPAAQGLFGLRYRLWEGVAALFEYKLGYADTQAELKGGRSLATETITHQLIFGVGYDFSLW